MKDAWQQWGWIYRRDAPSIVDLRASTSSVPKVNINVERLMVFAALLPCRLRGHMPAPETVWSLSVVAVLCWVCCALAGSYVVSLGLAGVFCFDVALLLGFIDHGWQQFLIDVGFINPFCHESSEWVRWLALDAYEVDYLKVGHDLS